VALVHLFGFGHTQSDNVNGKNPKSFQKNIHDLLKTHDVVIADRNNHLSRHRIGIREAVSPMQPPPRLIALNWSVTSGRPATVHRIATDRIVSRGDNHQNLTLSNVPEYEEVVWRFLKESEELGEDEVDDVIEMEIEEGLEESLERAVSGVVDLLGLEKPSDEKMGEALRIAREYEPAKRAVTKRQSAKQSKAEKKKEKTRYYGLLPELDLSEVLGAIMNSNTPVPDSGRLFWEKLKDTGRYASRPHVTIVHSNTKEDERELWDACDALMQAKPPLFEFSLSHIVWNDRVMALAVDDLKLVGEGGGEGAGDVFLKTLDDSVKHRLHITVGTKDPSIPPVEAKDMVKDWRAGKATETLALNGITAKGRIKGLIA
jgi:tRNA ligase